MMRTAVATRSNPMRSLARREVLPSGAGSAMAGESGSSLLIHEDSHEWMVVSSEVRTGRGPHNLWPRAIFLQKRKGGQASSQRLFPMNSQPSGIVMNVALALFLWSCSDHCGAFGQQN